MVHRFHRRSQLRDLSLRGQQLLDGFCSKGAEVVLLALDFEGGNDGIQSIRECGVASFSDGEEAITNVEFATKLHTRKIRFGETVLCDPCLLKDRLIDAIFAVQRRYQARDILLVGHGIIAEMMILEALRVEISDLPIGGIVDIWALAQQVLGVQRSLGDLLSVLRIPMQKEALHCAANDAHFTMQLLLALLSTRYEECSGRWNDIITRPLPSPKYEREEQEDWSEDIEDVLDSLSLCG